MENDPVFPKQIIIWKVGPLIERAINPGGTYGQL